MLIRRRSDRGRLHFYNYKNDIGSKQCQVDFNNLLCNLRVTIDADVLKTVYICIYLLINELPLVIL